MKIFLRNLKQKHFTKLKDTHVHGWEGSVFLNVNYAPSSFVDLKLATLIKDFESSFERIYV